MARRRSAPIVWVFVFLFAVVLGLGVWHPAWLYDPLSRDATWVASVVAMLTLVVTAAIPVALYVLGKSGERTTHELLAEQRRLLACSRLDVLAEQAEVMERPEDIRAILEEASELSPGRSLLKVEEAYWRNPAVPLTGSIRPLNPRGAQVVARALHRKLDGQPTFVAMRSLTKFVLASTNLGESVHTQVAEWVVERSLRDDPPQDGAIRDLLMKAPAALFGALLWPLDQLDLKLPTHARVNIIAGTCFAYLDRIGYDEKRVREQNRTLERAAPNVPLSMTMAEQLASLLHRDRLRGLATWEADSASIDPDSCAALVVAVAGAVSFCDDHWAKRMLENVAELGIRRGELGTFEDNYDYGLARFEEYQPQALTMYWPRQDR